MAWKVWSQLQCPRFGQMGSLLDFPSVKLCFLLSFPSDLYYQEIGVISEGCSQN